MKTRSRIETLPVSKIYLEEFGKGVRECVEVLKAEEEKLRTNDDSNQIESQTKEKLEEIQNLVGVPSFNKMKRSL